MTVWKNPCLLCGCGISVYWPLCTCDCHKQKENATTIIKWNNEEKAEAKPETKTVPATTAENKS